MRNPSLRAEFMRSTAVMSLSVVLALVFAVTASAAGPSSGSGDRQPSAARAKPAAKLNAVGARFVGAPIPITGRVRRAAGRHQLVLQGSVARNRWSGLATARVRNGRYQFAPQYRRSAGTVAFRTVLYTKSRPVAVSNVITVRVVARPPAQPRPTCASAPSPTTCPRPQSVPQQRTIEDPAYCPHLTVLASNQARTVGWAWDTATRRWVEAPTPWATVSESKRPASAAECLKIVSQTPAGAALPDLRIKDLTKCGTGDLAATNNTCFMIIPSAPVYSDFPLLAGRKLLKFPVITMNVGAGSGEIIADRSAPSASDWKGYQSFYDADGQLLGSVLDPSVRFYFAGDGHNHWHVEDFDEYTLLDAGGTAVARAEKHGYCMQDNSSYTPMQGQPGVSTVPVYTEATSCGKGLPNALSIVHGLSRGWGDTYPISLPDQAIDITGMPDGEYTVRVHADAVEAVQESNESNNTAELKVQITGDTVTVVPGSSTGGLT